VGALTFIFMVFFSPQDAKSITLPARV
jgi:hypothetical protein